MEKCLPKVAGSGIVAGKITGLIDEVENRRIGKKVGWLINLIEKVFGIISIV